MGLTKASFDSERPDEAFYKQLADEIFACDIYLILNKKYHFPSNYFNQENLLLLDKMIKQQQRCPTCTNYQDCPFNNITITLDENLEPVYKMCAVYLKHRAISLNIIYTDYPLIYDQKIENEHIKFADTLAQKDGITITKYSQQLIERLLSVGKYFASNNHQVAFINLNSFIQKAKLSFSTHDTDFVLEESLDTINQADLYLSSSILF
jgi:hypothetical protein